MKGLVDIINRETERVFIVGVQLKGQDAWCIDESLDELAELVGTAGGEIVGRGSQRLDKVNAATFIGPGKAREFAEECAEGGVDTVVFDEELTPAQGRNLEKVFECKILDRTALILDIFSQRARTREGKLQVEMSLLLAACIRRRAMRRCENPACSVICENAFRNRSSRCLSQVFQKRRQGRCK